MNGVCDVPRCRQLAEYIYYRKDVCEKHWQQYCDEKIELKEVLKVGE